MILASLALLFASAFSSASFAVDSGSYYNPAEPGYGFLVDSDGETSAVWMFTYGFESDDTEWFVSSAESADATKFELYRPTAVFPAFGFDLGEQVGTLTVIPGDQGATFFYQFWGAAVSSCSRPGFSPMPTYCDGVVDTVQLLPRGE